MPRKMLLIGSFHVFSCTTFRRSHKQGRVSYALGPRPVALMQRQRAKQIDVHRQVAYSDDITRTASPDRQSSSHSLLYSSKMNLFRLSSLYLFCTFVCTQTSQEIDVQRRDLISDFVNEIIKDLEDATECAACEVMPIRFQTFSDLR
jgi:hypothetical protein